MASGMQRELERDVLEGEAGPDLEPGASASRSKLMRQLFEEHNRALVNFLATRLNSESEAMDVAQEAYVHLLQLDRPDAVGFLRAYLFRVAANIAVDHLRKRAVRKRSEPQQSFLFEQLLAQPGPERMALGGQQLDIVKAALKKLPDKCRQACVLHLFADCSVKDIAAEMGLTERMIRYHIARGLARCRIALDTIS